MESTLESFKMARNTEAVLFSISMERFTKESLRMTLKMGKVTKSFQMGPNTKDSLKMGRNLVKVCLNGSMEKFMKASGKTVRNMEAESGKVLKAKAISESGITEKQKVSVFTFPNLVIGMKGNSKTHKNKDSALKDTRMDRLMLGNTAKIDQMVRDSIFGPMETITKVNLSTT